MIGRQEVIDCGIEEEEALFTDEKEGSFPVGVSSERRWSLKKGVGRGLRWVVGKRLAVL